MCLCVLGAVLYDLKRVVPVRKLMRRAFTIHGKGALYNMFVSTAGYAIASRISFLDYCENLRNSDDGVAFEFCSFLTEYFRVRNITNTSSEVRER